MRPFLQFQTKGHRKKCSPGLNCWASKSDAWTHNKLRRTEETHGSCLNMELRKQDGKYYEPLKLEVTALLLSLLWNIMAAGDRTLMENSLPGPTNTATSKVSCCISWHTPLNRTNQSSADKTYTESLRKSVSVCIYLRTCYVLLLNNHVISWYIMRTAVLDGIWDASGDFHANLDRAAALAPWTAWNLFAW